MIRQAPLQSAVAALALALLVSPRLDAQKPKAKPALPEGVAPFEIATITPGSWYGRFGSTNCSWIDLGDGVLVIDTGGSPADAQNLQKQIKETTKGKPVKWIVLTHGHQDSNAGVRSFLPTDATIFVNGRVAASVAAGLTPKDSKATKTPTIIGVGERTMLVTPGHRIELRAPSGSAHTDSDLFAYDAESGVAYVGDLVTPGACPMMSDPNADPTGWIGALAAIEAFHPALIVPTRRDASKLVQSDIGATRTYVARVMELLADMKKKGYPEARVASELQSRKLGDFCPVKLDSTNVVTLYRRTNADGTVTQAAQAAPVPAAAKK